MCHLFLTVVETPTYLNNFDMLFGSSNELESNDGAFFLSNIRIALKSHTTPLTNSKNLFFHAFPESLSPIREQQAIRIFRIIVT